MGKTINVKIPEDAYNTAKEEAPKLRQTLGGYFAHLIDKVKHLEKELLKKK